MERQQDTKIDITGKPRIPGGIFGQKWVLDICSGYPEQPKKSKKSL